MGQALGDVVLREIAERLVDALRTTDRVSRIGGDEFLVGLIGTRMAEAEQVAERIRCSVAERPVVIGGRELSLTVSIGLCNIPPDVVSLEEVVSRVQRTLSISKQTGKNRVVAERDGTEPEEVPSNLGRKLIDQVHRGLELRTCIQTVRNLMTGEVVGHEFFVRGPEGPFEQPEDLFRLCMEEDYLTMMDLACLRRSVRLAREHKISGDLHVNLFPTTLLDTMPDALVGLLADVDPRRFCIELSEQQLVGDPGFLRDRVAELQLSGVRVALDDVGFGRSSLESLIVLEPDVIKIDRTIVHELDVDRGRRKALHRLVAMAESLDVSIVAEGVEREPEREALLEAGVGVGQGYLFDRPAVVNQVS
jgi:EAL domain-containing protein (putative c-di-GMP-specific phosphodiesterase class I)